MRIAHISDLHLRPPQLRDARRFLGKRLLGSANLALNRAREFPPELAATLQTHLRESYAKDGGFEHLIISGDLTNLSLPQEFAYARAWVDDLNIPASAITIVPGNHDAYTSDACEKHGPMHSGAFEEAFEPYLQSDVLEYDVERAGCLYPVVHLRKDVAIIALSSAIPSAPLHAIGTLGNAQISAAKTVLNSPEVKARFRVIVLHHAPCGPHVKTHTRLTDAKAFAEMVACTGADLVVHGHLHRTCKETLAGPDSCRRPPDPEKTTIPVHGVCAATWLSQDVGRTSRYHVYDVGARAKKVGIATCYYDRETRMFG